MIRNLRRGVSTTNNLIPLINTRYEIQKSMDYDSPLLTGKERVVVLGCGWAGSRLASDICTEKYDLTVISSKNHMVFTPLLASSCVGTIHPQSVVEHIRHLQPELKNPQNHFYLAYARDIDTFNNKIICQNKDHEFSVNYDKLVIAVGGTPTTYGIPGVRENTFFLKTLDDSEKIRKRILENICESGIPNITIEERNRLLHFVIVGGGPTGVEMASELANFINEDMFTYNPQIKSSAKITLIEGNEILSNFDYELSSHALKKLIDAGVYVKKANVREVSNKNIILEDNSIIDYGLCIWSTGIGTSEFIKKLKFSKSPNGRIYVDDTLKVYDDDDIIIDNVYAIGDSCVIKNQPLPPLAQVAEQQGRYLAKNLNNDDNKPFIYNHFGSMVSLTTLNGISQLKNFKFKGILSWIMWRSAYFTKLQTFKSKINIISQYIGSYLKGRDIGL